MLFTSQHEHTIDAKQRLAIPSEIRSRWRAETEGTAWFAVPWPGGLIRLYPERAFEIRASSGELTLTPDEDEAELQATLFGLSARLEMDSAGRIRFPEEMLSLVGLGTEVVLVGAGDRLEVRDRAEWSRSRADRLGQLPELMARISARKGHRPQTDRGERGR